MIKTRVACAVALAASLTIASACERGSMDPAQTGSVALSLQLFADAAAGGPAGAFDRADSMLVRVRVGNRVRYERVVPIAAGGSDLRLGVEVPATGSNETAIIEVELRLGRAALFRGDAPVTLRVGRDARLSIALAPVIAGVIVPDSAPSLSSYGETVTIQAAAVFATGDTAEIVTVEWSSLDPAVVAIEGGTPTSRGDGVARLVARLGEHTDTMRVRVFAIVRSIVVSPDLTTLDLGASRTLTALLLDARANVVTGRPIDWSSSDPAIISVGADGKATGRGVGIARISATSGEATSSALVEAVAGVPSATTREPDQITLNGARLHGAVAPGGVATQVWFEWSKEPTFTIRFTTPTQTVSGGSQPVDIVALLGPLVPNTRYFYRLIARNGVGTSVGEAFTFATTAGVPAVITDPASGISRTAATLHGRVTSNGAGTAWFEISASSDPAGFTARATVALGAGTIQIGVNDPVTGLQPGTTYYFQLVATTSEGQRAGGIRSFTTLPEVAVKLPPTVTTQAAGPIRTDSAVANALVNPNGTATQVWFEYDTDPDFDEFASTAPQPAGAGVADVAVQQLIQGLAPATTYYVRAAASSDGGTVRGAGVAFTTAAPPPVAPVATTVASSQVGQTAATLSGRANPRGSDTEAWFEYGTDAQLAGAAATTAQAVGAGGADVAYAEGLTGLAAGTTYYFRAVARNVAGTHRGAIQQFTTQAPPPAPPTVTTEAGTASGQNTASLAGTVNPNGSATQVWFQYSTDPQLGEPALTTKQAAGAGSAAAGFNAQLSQLQPGTTYYFRAAAQNVAGTVYGATLSFRTAAPPQPKPAVTTQAANPIRMDSAVANALVNPNGAATTAWFEYGTAADLATYASTAQQAVGAGSASVAVQALIQGLQPGATYYVRAAASNGGGTTRGAIVSFTTQLPPLPPAVTTQPAGAIGNNGATIHGTVNPNGYATTTWFEVADNDDYVNPTSTAPQPAGAGTTAAAFSQALTGLVPGSTHYYRAVAQNAHGTARGAWLQFTTTTPLPGAPRVSTDSAWYTDPYQSEILMFGTVNPNGRPTEGWFEVGLLDVDGNFVAVGTPSQRQQVGAGFADVVIQTFRDEDGTWMTSAAALSSNSMLEVRVRAVASNDIGETSYGQPFKPIVRNIEDGAASPADPGYRPATPGTRSVPAGGVRRGGGGPIDGGTR